MEPGWFQITLKLFLWQGDRYLALRDSHTGYGDLPGGRIGETELDLSAALRRELVEELGSDASIVFRPEPVTIFPHFVLKDQAQAFAFVFEGQLTSGELQLSDEHTEFRWMQPAEDPASIFVGSMLNGVKKYLATEPLHRIQSFYSTHETK